MKHTVTLREIHDEFGISRKAIQGYEQLGLIRPCGKNRYGHLLYDRESLSLIIRIRFFQKLGFSLKQIVLFALGVLTWKLLKGYVGIVVKERKKFIIIRT